MYKNAFTAIFSLINIIIFLPLTLYAQTDSTYKMVPIGTEAFEVMRDHFNYDSGIPLEVRILETSDESEYVREKIVFNGIRDSRVPGYLAIPKTSGTPYPCVLLLHGIGSSKETWWDENSFYSGGYLAEQLLASGFAVLALDVEYHGERLLKNDFESPNVFTLEKGWLQRARDMIVQSVIEHRRVIDYLSTRGDIDTSRIGMIGTSMGGMMCFMLTGVDQRVKVSIASVTPILKDKYSAISVHNFAPYINNQPFLMLVGENDKYNYSMEDARQLYNLINSDSKDLIIYESGHKLPVEWTNKANDWMIKYLK